MNNLSLARKYAPHIYFDRNEPFYPVRVGVTIFTEAGPSPSFPRTFLFKEEQLDFIIEYAIYWDYDIQHLYELEHIWVYVDKAGGVLDCEGSSHGGYLKGMLKDRSNVDGSHVKLFSQPGKHAFSPMKELFELLPDLEASTYENAGRDGLLVKQMFKGALEKTESIDHTVRNHLQTLRFKPSLEYVKYEMPVGLYVSWDTLQHEIPQRIRNILKQLGT